jgi:hypothetical protein
MSACIHPLRAIAIASSLAAFAGLLPAADTRSQASSTSTPNNVITVLSAEHGVTTGTIKPAITSQDAQPNTLTLLVIAGPNQPPREVVISQPAAIIRSGLFTSEPRWGGAIGSLNIDRFEPAGRPGINSTRVPAPTPTRLPNPAALKVEYLLTTTTGSRIIGELTAADTAAPKPSDTAPSTPANTPPAAPAAADITLRSERLGTIGFALTDVLAIDTLSVDATGIRENISTRSDWATLSRLTPAADQLTLNNGDVLEGLIEKIDPASKLVTLSTLSGSAPARTISLANIKAMHLAQPIKPDPLAKVWLTSGEVLAAEKIQLDDRRVELISTVRSKLLLPLGEIDSAQLQPQGLLPASAIVTAEQARIVPSTGILNAQDIVLTAPTQAILALPPADARWTRSRLVGFVVLDEASRKLGTLTVKIELEEKLGNSPWETRELGTFNVSASSTVHPINLDLGASKQGATGRRVVITLDPTSDGPIQDVIVLRGMMIVGQ